MWQTLSQCLRRQGGWYLRNDTQGWPLASTHMYAWPHTYHLPCTHRDKNEYNVYQNLGGNEVSVKVWKHGSVGILTAWDLCNTHTFCSCLKVFWKPQINNTLHWNDLYKWSQCIIQPRLDAWFVGFDGVWRGIHKQHRRNYSIFSGHCFDLMWHLLNLSFNVLSKEKFNV